MASQHRAIGKNGYISFQGTEVSADYRSFEVEMTLDTVEKSAGSDSSKAYIATLKDGTAKLTYAYTGTAGSAYTQLLRVGQQGQLLWGPEGNGSGKPKGGANAIVVAHSKPMAYNELMTRTVTFQFTGELLFDDEVDTWT
jgi:hypothetical protein